MSGVVAVVSSDERDVQRLRSAVGNALEVIATIDAAAALSMFESDAAIVISEDLVARTLPTLPEEELPPVIVLGDPASVPPDPRITFVARRQLPPDQMRALLVCLAERHPVHSYADTSPHSPAEARRVQRAFAASRRLAGASDLGSTEQVTADAVLELVDADRAFCLFHDGDDGALWSEARLRSPSGDDRRAIAGLAGWSARTGLPALTTRAGDDPRWLAAVDDPEGDPTSQIITQPVVGADGQVHAVLVAVRRGRRSELGEAEQSLMARFATLAAPLLDTLSIHVQSQAILDEAAGDPGIFRKEALEAQVLPRWGDVVRVSPGWLSWTYWALVVLLIASIVFVSIGRIKTYSTGPAVIRSTARVVVTSPTTGSVTSVELAPGDAVAAGDVIARLDDVDQRASVDRLGREFETQLRNHMLDPADANADSSLRSLRLQLEQARTALEQRQVRATAGGLVSDVRVHPGQHIQPGDIVASVVDGSGGLEVVALLPGADRPQLGKGMALRLELAGYRYVYQTIVIDSVSEVMSPNEAKRQLGPEVADFQLGGPVVLVKGRLGSSHFDADGKTFAYNDGMIGTGDVAVRSERILYAIIPGLRRF